MISGIFAVIELILKLIGLWEQFGSFMDAKRAADAEKKTQDRNKAVDDLGKAQTEEEFDDAQDRIVRNKPGP